MAEVRLDKLNDTSHVSSHCKFWDGDDITRCSRHKIDTWLLLTIGTVSLVVLVLKSYQSASKKPHGELNLKNDDEQTPLGSTDNSYGSTGLEAERTCNNQKNSIKDRHFDLTHLSDTNSDGSPRGQLKEVFKSPSDRARVAVEFVLVLVEFGMSLSLFFVKSYGKEFNNWGLPGIRTGLWGYLLLIISIRLANMNRVNVNLPSLWAHSTFLYFFNFISALIWFRSALVGLIPSHPLTVFFIWNFVISFSLLLLNVTAKVGDKPARLFVTSDGAKPSPENNSSILSLITYSWIDGMVWTAYKSAMALDDVWGLREDDYALRVLRAFEAGKSYANFTYNLFFHFKYLFLLQAFFAVLESFLIFAPSLILKKVLEYVDQPALFPSNIAWTLVFMMPVVNMMDSVSSGSSLFLGRRVCIRMKAIIIGEVYAKALRRKVTPNACKKSEDEDDNADIAKKGKADSSDGSSLSNDQKESAKESADSKEIGAIINLMAIDAFKVSEVCGYLHFFVSCFLMIFICIFLLYNLLGVSSLFGSACILILFPINLKFSNLGVGIQKKMLGITDKRIQKLNETILSVRIIKFFGWEQNFIDSIMDIRNKELSYLKYAIYVWTSISVLWLLTSPLITLLSFAYYILVQGKTLTAPVAFTALSLFSLLRSPLDQLSEMTSIVVQSKVSLDRIDEFLKEDETSKYDQLNKNRDLKSPYIGFEDATLSWSSKHSSEFKLRDIDISFKPGQLNVIIGPTGSGKTSLLLALLGEMELLEGKVFLPGTTPRNELVVDPQTGFTESVAYCAQTPWLLNDTIRNNIIFFSPFNQERYDCVVEACSLKRDFEILSGGDATEIGEKGITLSGGQKQRVSLARAIYSNSKHVLLDDCLSAVDSHSALWIREKCLTAPIMSNRTCILVSHNIALTVKDAALVVCMHNGRVKNQGTPEELLATGDLGDDELVKTSVLNSRAQSTADLSALKDKSTDLKRKAAEIDSKLQLLQQAPNPEIQEAILRSDGKLVDAESKATGAVGKQVYLGYIHNLGGMKTLIAILAISCFSQFVYICQSWWVKVWTLHYRENAEHLASLASKEVVSSVFTGVQTGISNYETKFFKSSGSVSYLFSNPIMDYVSERTGNNSPIYYLVVYALIGLATVVVGSGRHLFISLAGIRASRIIFKDVLTKVMSAKLRYFDKTPQGRIMNRMSKDIESVDEELPPCAAGVLDCVVQCVFILALIAIITPGFLIIGVLIVFLYYLVGVFYLTLSRELKRFDSITKSPIHQHFSESLVGVSTIRAYGIESTFMKQNILAIDANNKPFFYLWVSNRWLSFRVNLVGSLVMFFSGVFVLLSIGRIDAGLAGLSLSYAISFSDAALWIVRLYSNLEMNMNSVERLQEFLEIDQELPYEIPENKPRASWPEKGQISVQDLSLRYAPDLPKVIKDVSFEIKPCQNVGIVGRTGAGKSTIITAFFRFLDPETGTILIDGVDISKIGLHDLRKAITIIPQDPTLFSGTIRSNLDLFDQYTDEQIFEALRQVNLINDRNTLQDENQNVFSNLKSSISEGGNNLSQGERQLVCLARSLLKNPKVILLDEATSSIDYESDATIQKTIREQFASSTVLTIAHRLRTIIDYDKILVMDAGKVVEYDNPYILISDKKSLFNSMCANSGELDSLVNLAKMAYLKSKYQNKT